MNTDAESPLIAKESTEEFQIPRTRTSGWLIPLFVLLVSLYVQNAGLYFGTITYVRWMDELSTAVKPSASTLAVPGDQADPLGMFGGASSRPLDDPVADMIRGVRMIEFEQSPWGAGFWINLMTGIVSALLGGWVARSRDLRVYTRVIFTLSVLAVVKGFVAWATVLPDPEGWEGCQRRLGSDGLAYYRTTSGGLEAVIDIFFMEVRGLWMPGKPVRQRVCADTIFSMPTCFCTVCVLSLYEVVWMLATRLEDPHRLSVRSLVGLMLSLVLAFDVILTVQSPSHYTIDVLTALPLAILLVANPAIATAVEAWSSLNSPSPVKSALGSSALLEDLGQTSIVPCCVPLCFFGGNYFLRSYPTTVPFEDGPRWTEERAKQFKAEVEHLRQLRDSNLAEMITAQEAVEQEEASLQKKLEQGIEENRRRVEAARARLKAEGDNAVASLVQQLDSEVAATTKLEKEVLEQTRLYTETESEYEAATASLAREIEQAQGERRAALESWSVHQDKAKQSLAELDVLKEVLADLRLKSVETAADSLGEQDSAALYIDS